MAIVVWAWWVLAHEDIVLVPAFLHHAVWKSHNALTVLDALLPLTSIHGVICPIHLTIAIPLIIHIIANILVASRPHEGAISMLLVIMVLAVISIRGVDLTFRPLALAVLHAVSKLA